MNKKKNLIISISVVLFIVITVFSVTYAYLVAITNEENVNADSGMLGINYDLRSETSLSGNLNASASREGGLIAVASASLETDSEAALFNMYITPTVLTDNLKVDSFKWEVVVDEVVINHGDFSDKVVNSPIKVVNAYKLTTSETVFTIYIWLDATTLTTAVNGASFKADITADSVPITGSF